MKRSDMAGFLTMKNSILLLWWGKKIFYVFPLYALLITSPIYSQKTIPPSAVQRNVQANDYLKALLQFETWAESEWNDYPEIPGSGYFGDGASDGNGGIRGNNSIILSYTVLIRAFPDAPENHRRMERIVSALKYSTKTHKSYPSNLVAVDGKKWGVDSLSSQREGWQTSLWSALMGFSAALT